MKENKISRFEKFYFFVWGVIVGIILMGAVALYIVNKTEVKDPVMEMLQEDEIAKWDGSVEPIKDENNGNN